MVELTNLALSFLKIHVIVTAIAIIIVIAIMIITSIITIVIVVAVTTVNPIIIFVITERVQSPRFDSSSGVDKVLVMIQMTEGEKQGGKRAYGIGERGCGSAAQDRGDGDSMIGQGEQDGVSESGQYGVLVRPVHRLTWVTWDRYRCGVLTDFRADL